ncbi:hypothetical protein DYB32_000118 [Aphanomyces invadans]|uniref:Uncharacterized protein n=1 Tax=Aphanomyces invadans TaxID=157072 RepID=A0A418BAW3_9STRA|nr:hypothetical protein DYB32_000118 [Aphanomyces invadans]
MVIVYSDTVDWIRLRLRQKCVAVREKHPPLAPQDFKKTTKQKNKKILTNTGAYLAQASKMGVYGELINVLLVVIDVLMKM